MDELFGAPVTGIAAVLAIAFGFAMGFLFYINLRNPILVRMAFRNVLRRPGQSLLILVGLMLATAIISSAFTIGDSVTFSIKRVATDSLRSLDELVVVDEDSPLWEGQAVPEGLPEEAFRELALLLDADPDIDGTVPALTEDVAVINLDGRQFEAGALLAGLDPARAAAFEALWDTEGNPVDLAALGPDTAYITKDGAEELQVAAGEPLSLALGPGALTPITVAGVVDGAYVGSGTDVVLMMPLEAVQGLLDRPGELSSILISNRGDAFSGADLTDAVVARYEDAPAVGGRGLEIVPIKQNIIDQANEAGSLFVSLFTTFGLFSIGVGLLLIFLIFSMLAAERKSEMGMARAVGMQRQHLVRMFTVEGAIYGIGSALIGAAIGVGLGFVLVAAVAAIFSQDQATNFTLSSHVEPVSFLTSFLAGAVLTFATVVLASRRISRLNIVQAIRDIPEPQTARPGWRGLLQGLGVTGLGVVLLLSGFQAAHLTVFGLGVSLIPIGIALLLHWRGVPQRWPLTGVGAVLVFFWLLPSGSLDWLKEEWNQDLTGFFVSGTLLVGGAVLVTVNNASLVLGLATATVGRFRRLSPIVKSAVAYPLRFAFRTGLSVAMFAIVIFSVIVMATLLEVFDNLFDDQQRLGGGYEVIAFTRSDLNPVTDLQAAVVANPDLAFVERVDGAPSVGTFRTVYRADARLSSDDGGEFADTILTGVGADFLASNEFTIALAAEEYVVDGEVESAAVWRALQADPSLAVVNAVLVPTRNNFAFQVASDRFTLSGVEGLFQENDVMAPVDVTVRDLDGGGSLDLTVIGMLDPFASGEGGPMPIGFYASEEAFGREVDATQFFFNLNSDAADGAAVIESAFFHHGVETLNVREAIDSLQESQRAIFNLLIGFMMLGLVVGIAALGVISARAVVERRHQIGVLRAIGFSRGMVQTAFLAESSFIAALGIGLGLLLGLLSSVNLINDIRADEPNLEFVIPWLKVFLIVLGAYLFSLLTTFLPAREASRVAPADALRYE